MENQYLSIQGVQKKFGRFTALDNISVDIKKSEFVCLLGPSGCGKTTLLRIIAGLENPTAGTIVMNGRDMANVPPAKRNFGIVFQSYALFPNLTAMQNIEYGLKAQKRSRKEVRERALEALALVDLEQVKNHYPAQMSGGQQQRVALARAVAMSPDFLLLDEPLSALDAKVRERLRYEIREIQEKLQITTVMVTHDQDEAMTMADKIVVMNDAQIMQYGSPQEVYQHPKNSFVADFIGSINFWRNQQQKTLAIRPEHIRLSRTYGINAEVEAIEFHGPVFLVHFKVNNPETDLHKSSVKVHVTMHELQEFKLEKGSRVYLDFSPERILAYEA
ncbi:ATP-binding cassette domain-containing protein [Halobacillus shinanisalinarum]|uniref:ATP-binding cassette domain-containing protein n=1 Tax=Halobacillus shinanisalinarum TaxID=2932258 RepID=A0ABY4H342_9BACI|nr:ATP-binding cassette domain-containing protein [Halobacillus shinanisalinarum]UOQ94872.1 ATP-binding cassette domain-containing protein [Halobacillus shinanisalinarum]